MRPRFDPRHLSKWLGYTSRYKIRTTGDNRYGLLRFAFRGIRLSLSCAPWAVSIRQQKISQRLTPRHLSRPVLALWWCEIFRGYFMKSFAVGAMLAGLIAGCATEPTYVESLANRRFPTTPVEVQQECSWIRAEIARQNSLSAASPTLASSPTWAVVFQSMAAQNVAALESRAATVGCQAAFTTATSTVIQQGETETTGQKIQRCIDVCVANTQRTPEQCFDQCIELAE